MLLVSVGQLVGHHRGDADLFVAADAGGARRIHPAGLRHPALPAPAGRRVRRVRHRVGRDARRDRGERRRRAVDPGVRRAAAHRRAGSTRHRRHRRAQYRGAADSAWPASRSASWPPALAIAGVVLVGVLLGVDGNLTVGQLTAFLFLVTLFIQPVQMATEVLNEAQNAMAGWRRVLDILDVSRMWPTRGDRRAVTCPPGRGRRAVRRRRFRLPGRPRGAAAMST